MHAIYIRIANCLSIFATFLTVPFGLIEISVIHHRKVRVNLKEGELISHLPNNLINLASYETEAKRVKTYAAMRTGLWGCVCELICTGLKTSSFGNIPWRAQASIVRGLLIGFDPLKLLIEMDMDLGASM